MVGAGFDHPMNIDISHCNLLESGWQWVFYVAEIPLIGEETAWTRGVGVGCGGCGCGCGTWGVGHQNLKSEVSVNLLP